jgi:hypothetical protein
LVGGQWTIQVIPGFYFVLLVFLQGDGSLKAFLVLPRGAEHPINLPSVYDKGSGRAAASGPDFKPSIVVRGLIEAFFIPFTDRDRYILFRRRSQIPSPAPGSDEIGGVRRIIPDPATPAIDIATIMTATTVAFLFMIRPSVRMLIARLIYSLKLD